ncbi:ras GEF [Sistotremastrum niveocremeum HHB9708]|uniref:Ras GEF n=1 Tax=Sistotremastrum niveocremeum HHB9708 TaxID=1314777 RepID=A0A164Q7L2_9AGAM|nr:ras GEF [Sistotremastrum niveocremeum HHB9708]
MHSDSRHRRASFDSQTPSLPDVLRGRSMSSPQAVDCSLYMHDLMTQASATQPSSPQSPPKLTITTNELEDEPPLIPPWSLAPFDPASLSETVKDAKVTIAADGSFVETTSAQAAMDLKKFYDLKLGIGKLSSTDLRTSPFAISCLLPPGGSPVYRIDTRGKRTEGAALPQEEFQESVESRHSTIASTSSRSSRRPRISMRSFFTSSSRESTAQNGSAMHSTTTLANSHTSSSNSGSQRLKKMPSSQFHRARANTHESSASNESGDGGVTGTMLTRGSPSLRSTAGDHLVDVLGWGPSAARRRARLRTKDIDTMPDTKVVQPTTKSPFGAGVIYTAPPRSSLIALPIPALREAQSFESVLTARAPSESNLRLRRATELVTAETHVHESPASTPQNGSSNGSRTDEAVFLPRFSTVVFDVLQSYRGPELLDDLITSNTETVKLELHSPAPRDDPRFVIWGSLATDPEEEAPETPSHGSFTDFSAPHSHPDALSDAVVDPTKKMMVAATIERWIAQLTSVLDYDELLIFFLTYRSYISPVDLCHLLICRFHWSMEEAHSIQDEKVKSIVRVRTYVAFRYWLTTFFRVDFLPNKELCRVFADWLNNVRYDIRVNQIDNAKSLIKKLRKVAKECKQAHSGGLVSPSGVSSPTAQQPKPLPAPIGDMSNPADFAENIRRAAIAQDGDSDVDLDFKHVKVVRPRSLSGSGPSLVGIHQALGLSDESGSMGPHPGTAYENEPRPTLPAGYMLKKPLQMTILASQNALSNIQPIQPAPLLSQQSALSRAFVKTVGKLGRWRRVLDARSEVASPLVYDSTTFGLEPTPSGSILTFKEARDPPLKTLTNGSDKTRTPDASTMRRDVEVTDKESIILDISTRTISMPPSEREHPEETARLDTPPQTPGREDNLPAAVSAQQRSSILRPEVISLDDYELSDSDQEPLAPPNVRRLPKKLPLRKDLEIAHRARESVSSLGGTSISRSSIASSYGQPIEDPGSQAEDRSSEPLGNGVILEWQVNMFVDNLSEEDGPGDAEAALRRLEGQIDLDQQRIRESRVDGWLETVRNRESSRIGRNGAPLFDKYGNPLTPTDEDTDMESDTDDHRRSVSLRSVVSAHRRSRSEQVPLRANTWESESMRETNIPPPGLSLSKEMNEQMIPQSSEEAAGEPSNAEVVDSNRSDPKSQDPPRKLSLPTSLIPSMRLGAAPGPQRRRSFVLGYRSEDIARHWIVQDRDTFKSIKFEELLANKNEWMMSAADPQVLDWQAYMKELNKLKTESITNSAIRVPSPIWTARLRFNIMVKFIASEILLSPQHDRAQLMNKFVRIAWKCYLLHGYNTLVAIMTGLQTPWVLKVMGRTMQRLGIWETRIFEDLRFFTSRSGNFRFIREATEALAKAHPIVNDVFASEDEPPVESTIESDPSQSQDGCVPFIGVYLTQLEKLTKLPDYIDPSAPTIPVDIDLATNALSAPAHPEVFSHLKPLPATIALEPLVNVHKQRQMAAVIKSLVAGQHLAQKVKFKVDHRLFWKCQRLKCLDFDKLQSLSEGSD